MGECASIKAESGNFNISSHPVAFGFFMQIFNKNSPKFPHFPLVLSAPHAGRECPRDFLENTAMSSQDLLVTADLYTDKLVHLRDDFASISANIARVVVDLNRAPSLLDPLLIEGAPPNQDPYVKAGYGVIPRFAKRGRIIQNQKLTRAQADARMAQYYHPYHKELGDLQSALKHEFGEVILLDIHSAPQSAMGGADIVLGTHYGRSMKPEIRNEIHAILSKYFSKVQNEIPFSGGYITQKFGQVIDNQHALQIEISRHWLENKNREFNQDFLKIWRVVLADIAIWLEGRNAAKLAAE